jgi:hypothetical protein
MNNSILSQVTQQLGGDTVTQLSRQLGIDERSAQGAINAALPLLVGALGRNTSTAEGAQSLFNALARDHDGSVLDNVAGYMLGGGNQQAGNGILGHVLGNKRPGVEQSIAQMTGLDAGTVGQMMTMVAPLLMGALGKVQHQQGLGVDDLAQLLGGARQEADSQMGGLAQLLDMNNDGSVVDDVLTLGSQLLGGLFGRKN